MSQESEAPIGAIIGIVTALVLTVGLGMWGCPTYNVYQSKMSGEAELAQADYSRQTIVVEAQAKLDSAKLLNQAEVIRAQGLAQATDAVSHSFGNPENYLRYLWIQSLENTKDQVIYIPTEGGLPILEAGKRP